MTRLFPEIYPEAVRWSEQFDSLQSAWDQCERGDWMMSYAAGA